ncbi:27319_t:CDS:2 [Racocetra persica]|uniref:27319_t:CDS:1 n=1 Tax=Racocetra persica TaxID=160502 RepID=A0ACA9KUH8_9GLOM|nr:27319_t:CDS:2 [Racocetra persica]
MKVNKKEIVIENLQESQEYSDLRKIWAIEMRTINLQLHYGIWAKTWWTTTKIEIETEMKEFLIPYRLYMRIACEFNSKNFIITVLSSNKNLLKLGFQCTCETTTTEIESNLLAAVKICYQTIFKTKTEYSGSAIIEFENINIIQQLIIDIPVFPIFIHIENLSVVVTNIGDLDENRNNVAMSSYHVDNVTESPVLYLHDLKSNLWNKFYETYPNGMKRTTFMMQLQKCTNLKYHDDLVEDDNEEGWALKGNQKLDNRGRARIKKNIKAMLEYFFLNRNRRNEDKMSARDMHYELLKFVEIGEIEKADILKIDTIQNWIGLYARAVK